MVGNKVAPLTVVAGSALVGDEATVVVDDGTDGGHGSSNHEAGVGEATSSAPQLGSVPPVNWNDTKVRRSPARAANGQRPTHGLNQFTLKCAEPPTGIETTVWYQNPVRSSTTPALLIDSTKGLDASVTFCNTAGSGGTLTTNCTLVRGSVPVFTTDTAVSRPPVVRLVGPVVMRTSRLGFCALAGDATIATPVANSAVTAATVVAKRSRPREGSCRQRNIRSSAYCSASLKPHRIGAPSSPSAGRGESCPGRTSVVTLSMSYHVILANVISRTIWSQACGPLFYAAFLSLFLLLPLYSDDKNQGSGPTVILCLFPLFSWLAYRSATMNLTWDEEGVLSKGLLRTMRVPWSEIRGVSFTTSDLFPRIPVAGISVDAQNSSFSNASFVGLDRAARIANGQLFVAAAQAYNVPVSIVQERMWRGLVVGRSQE